MSKHAEGPWEIRISEDTQKPYIGAGVYILAQPIWSTIPAGTGNPENRKASAEQSLANARLMAAAPELLEALQHLLEHTDHRGNACKLLAVGKAASAIRKAVEGE